MKKILTPGTQLQNGLYLIEKHLGGGGFGITYLATWIQGTQTKLKFIRTGEKTVVIKEFFYEDFCRRADHSNEILITDGQKRHEFEQLRSKLVSEANILNSFKHPHIVEVFDVFEENNTAYIVMEQVAGEDLEDRIIRTRYCSPEEAVRYISQIALALVEVHNKRVLHLDVSPSNILIDKTDNAQLIDFGISLTYDAITEEVKQTSKLLSGKKSGFSPPEQSLDSLHHFSPPIDLYALGATLYNALTGHKPPDSGSLSTGAEVLMLPSSYNPKVSAFLDFFVLKAMNIKINERFQKAAEFYDVLLNGEQQYTNAILRGNEYYASGNYHDALTHFEAAFQLINTNDDLNTKINRCKMKIMEEEEIEKYRQAIKVGDAHVKKENFRDAIKSYQQALLYMENDAYCMEQIKICKENLEKTIQMPIGDNDLVDTPEQDTSNTRLRVILLSIIGIVVVALIGFFIWNNIPEKTKPEWIAQYERHLSTANDNYQTENYRSALSEYNQALQLIPSDAKNASELKSALNSKINDCEQKISEQDKKLQTLKRDVNSAFEAKKWDMAYSLSQEIKNIDPNDYTGYNNFLKTGKELMVFVGCDGNVKDLLTKAKNIRNTNEVNELLEKCNWNIGQAQDYVKLGNDCFDKGDYECAKTNYNAQKIFGSAIGMEAKITQCDNCIKILNDADFLFSDKDYTRAKAKYEELLDKNAKDPKAKKQIEFIKSIPSSKTLQGVKLLLIKGGTFTMGSPKSEPDRINDEIQHSVTLRDFYLSAKAITNAQYCRFLNAKGIKANGQFNVSGYGNQILITAHEWGVQYTSGAWRPASGKDDFPVVNVNWFGAKAYCDWSGGRLPTEAEWEYACRAGTTTPFHTGNNLTTSQANYNGNYPYNNNTKGDYLERTQPVGSYDPNAWGLYDMHGNILEWCSDWFGAYKTGAVTNPKGPSSGLCRVLRSGSWFNYARLCRSAYRSNSSPDVRKIFYGFRIAASL